MASLSPTILLPLLFVLAFWVSTSTAQRPKALVVPVSKDPATLQYVLRLNQRTPPVPVRLTVDLGGSDLWVDCEDESYYVSSSYRPVPCETPLCTAAHGFACVKYCFSSPRPGCNNNTCLVAPENPFIPLGIDGEVTQDVVTVPSTDGSNPGRPATVPRFVFSCAPTALVEKLPDGVKGMAGLARTELAPPSQFAAAFGFPRKFAICLPSTVGTDGVIFFGDAPYKFLPDKVVSDGLVYTPLLTNPVSTKLIPFGAEPSYEYFIGVTGVRVNNKPVTSVNTSLLAIDEKGFGGTKISTVAPYTVLDSHIYKSVTHAFVKESRLKVVAPVAPFGHCFDARNVASTRVGPAVPAIDFVLQNENVVWRMVGANLMVQVKPGVMCLGFVDGGKKPRTTIVIGGKQLEDNLLQFDLGGSRLGFSSSLLYRQTTCSNFNFTAA